MAETTKKKIASVIVTYEDGTPSEEALIVIPVEQVEGLEEKLKETENEWGEF